VPSVVTRNTAEGTETIRRLLNRDPAAYLAALTSRLQPASTDLS